MAKPIVIDLTNDDDDPVLLLHQPSSSDLDVDEITLQEWHSAHTDRTSTLRKATCEPFNGHVIILDRLQALQQARSEYRPIDFTSRMVLWTDGSSSVKRGASGFAITYRENHYVPVWTDRGFMIPAYVDNHQVELFAIGEALKLAIKNCRDAERGRRAMSAKHISSIVIYSDSRTGLELIRDYHLRSEQRQDKCNAQVEVAKIRQRAYELHCLGVQVWLRWLPGHNNTEGNERADRLAHQASKGERLTKKSCFKEKIVRNTRGLSGQVLGTSSLFRKQTISAGRSQLRPRGAIQPVRKPTNRDGIVKNGFAHKLFRKGRAIRFSMMFSHLLESEMPADLDKILA